MERGRDGRYSRNKRGLAAYHPENATYLLLTSGSALLSWISRSMRATCNVSGKCTRELTDGRRERNETKHTNRGRDVGSAILGEQNLSENPTIGIAVGSAFVRRGTIDENAPQNSGTRRRVDFDARPGVTGDWSSQSESSSENGSINIVL